MAIKEARRVMNIAMIGTKGIPAKWGGIEKYVEEVSKRLVQRGHKVTVFGSGWYCKDWDQKTFEGINIHRVPAINFQATDALSNGLFSALAIMFGTFDIVHFHGYASYFFVPLLKRLGNVTIVTSHGLVDTTWKNPKYGGFALRTIRRAGSIGIRNAHRVTTVADYWRTRIKEIFDIDATVIPSGLDQVTLQEPCLIKQKYGIVEQDYVLFLGRIDPIKRIDWLLDLGDALPSHAKLVIAGGTQDAQTENYLRSLKKRADQKSNVIFTGPVVGQEKAELLTNCRLFVTPSSSEGLPITLLEAMSYGRCCVASSIPAHREVILDGKTGYLFSIDNKSELIESVRTLLMSAGESITNIGEAAKHFVSDRYDWTRTTVLMERIYEEALNEYKR